MSKISVLGLGAMGSRMAAHLVKAGHDVTVWNRAADTTKPLIAAGATQAQTPREAAAGAAFVVGMVRDDEARAWCGLMRTTAPSAAWLRGCRHRKLEPYPGMGPRTGPRWAKAKKKRKPSAK